MDSARIEPNQQFPIANTDNESKNLLAKSLSYSKDIINAIPPVINNSCVGPSIILGAACSLKAIISSVFPALNSTLMNSCITVGSHMFYETLSIVNKTTNDENTNQILHRTQLRKRLNYHPLKRR